MTTHQEHAGLFHRLEEVLGRAHAATLIAMLPGRADLVTKDHLTGEMAALRDELRGEMAALRDELKGEMAALRDELRGDMAVLRDELRGEMADLRSEVAVLRTEMATRYATKDDLLDMKKSFDTAFHSYVRTFIATQAVTVVGVSGIVFGLTRFL